MRAVGDLPAGPVLAAGHHAAAAGQGLGTFVITVVLWVLVLCGLAAAALRVRHGRWLIAIGIAVVAVLLGLAVAEAFADGRWLIVIVAAAGAVLVLATTRAAVRRARYGRRRPWLSLQHRLRWRLQPGPGFASSWALRYSLGLPAARRVARHARPSLSWLRRRLPGEWRGFAAFDGWAHGWLWRRRVYAPVESMRLIIAPPQEGKSAAAAGTILDAPGPLVATSIRGDLIAATAGLRARRGQIHIWNPEGVGDYASTLAWNLVEGCQDMTVAVRRAGYMIEATTARGLSDDSFWEDQASLVLGSYLHAAGLAAGTMRDVHRWVLEADQAPARILASHPGAAPLSHSQVTHYLSMPDKTRAGVSAVINNTLRFMTHPGVVATLAPAAGEGFDFEAFLDDCNTLYLVAADTATSPVSPLFTAMCAEITWHARQRPARLDPPLSMVLDEVANIAPVPAAEWATWAAGSGVWLHLYAQAWAQLVARWGQYGAATIWQACKDKLIYTATSEPELCEMVEDLCGTVRVRGLDDWRYTRTGRPRRRPTWEEIPVLPHAELRQLPAGHAVVIQGSAPPTIVRPEQYWKRADVRAYQRRHGPLRLPVPAPREIPEPMPDLLAEGQVPSHPARPAPGKPASPHHNPAALQAPHWTDAVPEIPRELFLPPPPADPPPPPLPRPPSRPAPWERQRSPRNDT
jgi:type IV secretion system protein VirD4